LNSNAKEKTVNLKPFTNESTCLQINGLTVENRLDKVSMYGSIEFTRDQTGLDLVRKLKGIIEVVAAQLAAEDQAGRLPGAIQIEKTVEVDNPLREK
jgi:hypothetical protein